MFSTRGLVTFFTALVGASISSAADLPYTLGQPTFFGSGCPKDSVEVVSSTDGKTLSVLYSQFQVATTYSNTRERKSCQLAVNVDIKPGFTVAISKVDYRGNVYVPNEWGSYAEFNAEYFFAGQRGPSTTNRYEQGANTDVFLEKDVTALVWSPCSVSTNFRVNADITVFKRNQNGQDVQFAIDTQDNKFGGFRYYVQYRHC